MKLKVVGITGRAGSGKDTVAEALIMERGYVKIAMADPLYRIMKLEIAKQNGDAAASYEMFKLVLDLFGGPLKAPPVDVVAHVVVNDMSRIAAETDLMKDVKSGTKPRRFLQELGTEYFRAYDPDVWVNYFIDRVINMVTKEREDYFRALETSETIIRAKGKDDVEATEGPSIPEPQIKLVITDVRFDNEGAALERLVTRVNEIGPDVAAQKTLICLNVPVDTAAKRVSERDGISVDQVLSRMGHASEHGVADTYIDHVVDADRPIEVVCREVADIIDGKKFPSKLILPGSTATGFGELVDLSKFKREA